MRCDLNFLNKETAGLVHNIAISTVLAISGAKTAQITLEIAKKALETDIYSHLFDISCLGIAIVSCGYLSVKFARFVWVAPAHSAPIKEIVAFQPGEYVG